MNLKAVEARKFIYQVYPSSSNNFLSFDGEVLRFVLPRVFYFGLTPTDIKPVNHQSLSAPYVLAGGCFMRDQKNHARKVGSNVRAFGGRWQCRFKSDKSKRIASALIADVTDRLRGTMGYLRNKADYAFTGVALP